MHSYIRDLIFEIFKFTQMHFQWDSNLKSKNMLICSSNINLIITNNNSLGTTESAVTNLLLNNGTPCFKFRILKASNSNKYYWRVIVGVVPVEYDPKIGFVGSQFSWGYVGGTGGKCSESGWFPDNVPYGEKYTQGDKIECRLNFERKTIEFLKNDKSMGIAFHNLHCAVKPAVSISGF
eukprot:418645_1